MKIGVKSQSYHQSQMHSDDDPAESIVGSDLEDGQLRKMLASPLYIQGKEENSEPSRAPEASGKPEAMEMQERGASAQRTQEERARCQVHLKRLKFQGNLRHCCQFSNTLIHQNFGRSLLERNQDHLLGQARSELMKQEHQMGSLNSCIDELQQLACAKR